MDSFRNTYWLKSVSKTRFKTTQTFLDEFKERGGGFMNKSYLKEEVFYNRIAEQKLRLGDIIGSAFICSISNIGGELRQKKLDEVNAKNLLEFGFLYSIKKDRFDARACSAYNKYLTLIKKINKHGFALKKVYVIKQRKYVYFKIMLPSCKEATEFDKNCAFYAGALFAYKIYSAIMATFRNTQQDPKLLQKRQATLWEDDCRADEYFGALQNMLLDKIDRDDLFARGDEGLDRIIETLKTVAQVQERREKSLSSRMESHILSTAVSSASMRTLFDKTEEHKQTADNYERARELLMSKNILLK